MAVRECVRRACARGIVLVSAFALSVTAHAQRLPGGVTPQHYALTITPNLDKATFAGTERIEVVLAAPARTITLNAAEIEFGAVRAYQWPSGLIIDYAPRKNWKSTLPPSPDLTKLDSAPQTATITLDASKEQATFTFPHELPAGPVSLEITYTGKLNDKLRGFYLSRGNGRSYGVTQFEATDARRAFPCFDEPALKATFSVTLVVNAGDTAISNMQVVSDTPGPMAGRHTVVFAETPKMSTYLVAWLVGDFECKKAKSDGVPIRACATPDKVKLTKTALETAKWTLHYYDKYFGIKYPMRKLDMVAIPDFESGAMENFGCITYRETEMLVDQKNGTLAARKEVATTVAHEISHQWFGDLVTPAWWDDLWLNEGFATWMETKAAGLEHPDWELAQETASDLNHTLDTDAEGATHAVRARAETPDEINALFDDISYGKAGAVIDMVEHWVSEEVFRRGVQQYLAAHLYGNATAEDFWTTQARVSGLPVDKVMRSFVDQPGVPLIQVENSSVTQQRFEISGATQHAEPEQWTIPVCFKGAACSLLTPDSPNTPAPIPNSATPFVFADAAGKGYYRTQYPAKDFAAIVANAETALTPPERIGLLGDRWALMRAGLGTVGDYLDTVLAMKHDTDPTVMATALARVESITQRVATPADRDRLYAVIRREFGPVYAALGGPSKHESSDHADVREALFEMLGEAKDPNVLAEAKVIAAQLFVGQKSADPMLGDAAIALSTPEGNPAMYDKLQHIAQSTGDPDFREAALHALTRFDAPALVDRTLHYAVSDAVRSQDSWQLIALLLERPETQDQAWDFIQKHWAEVQRKSTESSGERIVESAGAFCSVEKRDAVAAFFGAHPVESAQRPLAKSLERIDDCVRLRETQEPKLREWLDAHHS